MVIHAGRFLACAGLALSLSAATTVGQPAVRSYVILGEGDVLPADLAESVAAAGGTVTASHASIGIGVAESSRPNFAAQARRIAGVRSVVPDMRALWIDVQGAADTVYAVEADPGPVEPTGNVFFELQWSLQAIGAPQAWAMGARGAGVRVAVLDAGIDANHADLAPNLNVELSTSFVEGETFEYVPISPFDIASHGSHVSGIIAAADNNVGIVGVAPKAEIVMVKVISQDGTGTFAGVIAGMVYAVDIGADVINLSLAASFPRRGFCDEEEGTCVDASELSELTIALRRAAAYAARQGVIVIAAAGNEAINGDRDGDLIHLPAGLPSVISVSATGPLGWGLDPATNLDVPAFYSNFGRSLIDFAAPGGNIDFGLGFPRVGGDDVPRCPVPGLDRNVPCWVFDFVISTGAQDQYFATVGTSMSAPHVAGVAALLIGANGGSMSPVQVKSALRASADALGGSRNDPFFGAGRINAARAIELAGAPGPDPNPARRGPDFDGDGDVDLSDVLSFVHFITVSGTVRVGPTAPADFDFDGDVDLADFVALQAAYTGAQ